MIDLLMIILDNVVCAYDYSTQEFKKSLQQTFLNNEKNKT